MNLSLNSDNPFFLFALDHDWNLLFDHITCIQTKGFHIVDAHAPNEIVQPHRKPFESRELVIVDHHPVKIDKKKIRWY